MNLTAIQAGIIRTLQRRFGELPATLEEDIRILTHPEDIEILHGDVKICRSLAAVEREVTWLVGRHFGRVDGMRDAIFTVLGCRTDESAEALSEKAFDSHDLEELENLLLLASRSSCLPSMN